MLSYHRFVDNGGGMSVARILCPRVLGYRITCVISNRRLRRLKVAQSGLIRGAI